MSTIRRVLVQSHCNDLGGRVWNPAIRWHRKHAVFVTLEDADGRRGTGECWCFDAAPDALVAFLRTEVIPQVLGAAPEDLPALCAGMVARATLTARHGILASALSGVDIAAHGLRARARGVPLWRELAPAGRGVAVLYASGGLYGLDKTVSDLAREVVDMAARGFGIVKIKVGGLGVEEDADRARAALDALPAGMRLIVDGVYRYNEATALELFHSLPEGRIAAFQSPLPANDIAGMARLVRAGLPVMANEAEYRAELHARLVGERAVVFLQTAPVACGGVSRVLELCDLVRDTEVALSLEVSSTAIALMAACHLAAARDEIAHVEQHFVHTVFFDRLRLHARGGGVFAPPDAPGLGIDLPAAGLTREHEARQDQDPREAAQS